MTSYPVIVTHKARVDIQATVRWYNSKQKGLGKRFYFFFNQAISTLQSTPFFQIRYDEIRCLKIKRFPYLIHYLVDDEHVYILAVISTHQDPEKHWIDLNP